MTIKGAKGEQLAMFMTVGELNQLPNHEWVDSASRPLPRDSAPTRRGMINKVGESQKAGSESGAHRPRGDGRSLYESVKAEGVQEPITLAHGIAGEPLAVWDGAHRLASAAFTRPLDELVPVQHIDDDNYDVIKRGR